MKRTGLLHLYYGDGKGKTTAAMGLALRAMGSGKRVVILQFLKGGKSGEVPLLEQLGAKVYRGKAGQKFVFQMNEAEKEVTRQLQNANLTAAMADPADLLILDDLGAEFSSQFTIAVLYQLLNGRLMSAKPTIINSNLTTKELYDRYSERIMSRIVGNYETLRFLGADIRQLKRKDRG